MKLKLLLCIAALPAFAVEEGYFSKEVYPVLLRANCQGCHIEGALASGTRLRFPKGEISPAEIESFGKQLAGLVNKSSPKESPLLNKPTNREKHTGGRLIIPGSREESVLGTWVTHLASLREQDVTNSALPAKTVTISMRRLTHSQYNNTVRDLLGDQTRPADRFPREDFVHGFKNQVETQGIPPLLAESYSTAAERLARNAFRGGDQNRLVPCRPSGPVDMKCAAQFIHGFGQRAYRRPLTQAEFRRFSGIFSAEAKKSRNFLAGAQLVVETMLQSPNFLFRIERRPDGSLSGYEMASRLAFLLWDTIPDSNLLDLAASGALDSSAGLEKAARVMIGDPRARQALDEFFSQWLRYDLVLNTVKDRRLYPQFNPELAVAMVEETRQLINDLVWNDRSFMNLFTADYGFVNSELAGVYGIPAPPSEFSRVSFPAKTERAGILGQAAFLTMTSKPGDSSPTVRGLFVREQFLCQKIPDPPPGTNSNLPPVTVDKPQTNRDRLKDHVINPTCAGCHTLIDPIGYGFEKFDAIGKRREKLTLQFLARFGQERRTDVAKAVELELDTRGELAGVTGSSFSSPKELGQILGRSGECQECIVKQFFRYAFGRHENDADAPLIKQLVADFKSSQFRFKELIIALVRSDQFRRRVESHAR